MDAAYYRQWRRDHPEQTRAIAARMYDRRRQIIEEAKAQPCVDCGVQYPWWVMQFDHVTDDKEFTIGEAAVSLRRVKAEIAKCDVVCANCHFERTHQRAEARKSNSL